MHKDGLLRVGSRLVHAPLKEEAKYLILAPKVDPNIQAYIRHVYWQERHAGAMHVLCQTRQKVWILQGMQEAIKNCIKCQRMRKKPCSQQMAPLAKSSFYNGSICSLRHQSDGSFHGADEDKSEAKSLDCHIHLLPDKWWSKPSSSIWPLHANHKNIA